MAKADILAHLIYKITYDFPKNHFALVSQMQRSALSVPANLVEGYSRTTQKEKRRFYEISLSSLTELEYYIDFTYKLKLFPLNIYNELTDKQTETAKIIYGLILSTKR